MIDIAVGMLCVACVVNSIILTLMTVDLSCVHARIDILNEQFFKSQEKENT